MGATTRRTPGLRREEVATRAGIGTDWLTRLEQGRAVTPSATTIAALARALRLDTVGRDHLLSLARPPDLRRFAAERVPATLAAALARLPLPAYLTGRRWDLLAWNDAAQSLFDFDAVAPGDRNVLVWMLHDPRARTLFGPSWHSETARMVAHFRATHDLWAGDPAFAALLERLREAGPDFDAWWRRHDVRAGGAGRKILHRPDGTALVFDYTTLQSNEDGAIRLALYLPA